MNIFRIERYDGYYPTKSDPQSRDRFVYLDEEGGWTAKKGDAVQFTTWHSANDVSKNMPNATIVMSEVIGGPIKKGEKKVSATVQARKEAKKLAKKSKASKPRGEGPTKSDQIREMLDRGMTKVDIGRELGIAYQFVFQVAKKYAEKKGSVTPAPVDQPEDLADFEEPEDAEDLVEV